MPTYVCTASGKTLTAAQKGEIAAHITRVHSELTGAPQFFAQVYFAAPAAGDHFMGGVPSDGEQVFIRGEIRAGRGAEVKRKLLEEILAGVSRIAEIPEAGVWVYLNELPAGQMAEYGRLLPEPGAEAAWIEALPAAARERVHRPRKV